MGREDGRDFRMGIWIDELGGMIRKNDMSEWSHDGSEWWFDVCSVESSGDG